MSSLRSYLPVEEHRNHRVTVLVSVEFKEKVAAIARLRRWTVSDVVRAGLQKFLEEETGMKPKRFELKPMEIIPPIPEMTAKCFGSGPATGRSEYRSKRRPVG